MSDYMLIPYHLRERLSDALFMSEMCCDDIIEAVANAPLQASPPSGGDWQPVSTPPKESWLCIVCWADADGEHFDFDYYEDDCWTNHNNSHEHFMAVGGGGAAGPDAHCIGPSEDPPYMFWQYASGPTALQAALGEGK